MMRRRNESYREDDDEMDRRAEKEIMLKSWFNRVVELVFFFHSVLIKNVYEFFSHRGTSWQWERLPEVCPIYQQHMNASWTFLQIETGFVRYS